MKKRFTQLVLATGFGIATLGVASCSNERTAADSTTVAKEKALPEGQADATAAAPALLMAKDLAEGHYFIGAAKHFDLPTTNIKVVIHGELEGYGALEDFGKESAMLLERVVNSTGFKKAVLEGKYESNKGFTPEEIFGLILKAHELTNATGTDSIMDFRLRTINAGDGDYLEKCKWHDGTRTVGIDGAKTGVTATCTEFMTDAQTSGEYSLLAAHYMHEYMHMLGFVHPGATLAIKEKSAVYQIGYMVRDLVTNYGKPLQGTVRQDLKFETVINGHPRVLDVYESSQHVRKEEPLKDLSKHVGKRIKIRVESSTDEAAYGAVIVSRG